jgi:GNAT superfamily N-acetyltransferase
VVPTRTGDEVIIGFASAGPTGEPGTIEVGTIVEDAWQRVGVGMKLLDELLARAAGRGLTQVRFELLWENGWLADVLARRLGVTDLEWSDGELSLLCPLGR